MADDKLELATERDVWQLQAARYGLLSEVVLLIAKTSDLQRLLTGAINKVKWVIDFNRCTLALLNSDEQTYQLQTLMETRRNVPRVTEERVPLAHGIPGEVMRARKVRLISEPATARSEMPPLADPAMEDGSLLSILSLPLQAYDKMLGAITFGTLNSDGYSREDLKVALSFATHLALAIDRWQQTQQLQQANKELARLASFPELNPGPIIEVDLAGQIHYLNPAARHVFPECEEAGLRHPLLADLQAVTTALQGAENASLTDEVKIGDVWYQRIRHLVEESQRVRIYVLDITERKRAEAALHKAHEELEQRVEERTAELSRANVVLTEQIAERQRAEAALRESEERYRTLFEDSRDAITISTPAGKFIDVNQAQLDLFGYTRTEMLGLNAQELYVNPDERFGFQQEMEQKGAVRDYEVRLRKKDGTEMDCLLTGTVKRADDGSIVAYQVIVRDITERKRAERLLAEYSHTLEQQVEQRTAELAQATHQAQEARAAAEAANEAKSVFLANMSHEIRTPMNGVIGMTSLLLDTRLTPEQRDFAETIRNSSDALLTIINDILDFSKIEADKLELEHQPFDLRECLEGALDLLATAASKKGLDLAYLVDDQTPEAIVGDVTRLRQILVNLLSNAVKFTERGEVVLSVTAQPKDGSEIYEVKDEKSPDQLQPSTLILHFTVRDTGIGIPQDRMDRLFQSFSQVDASTTRRYGGTGLGLAISKRLSEMMGGSMWVESGGVVGQGTTFHFTIQTQAAPAPLRPYLQGTQPELSQKRVLIVDDNATNRRILTLQTQSWNMLPRETASPTQALEWIRQGDPFDLVILDMQMPEMDGVTLATEIQRERNARTLPLVMLTSLGRREAEVDSGAVEFAAFLTKPIKPSQLFDVLVGIFAGQPTRIRRREPTEESLFDVQMGQRLPLHILLAEDNATNQKLALHLLERLGYRADVAGNGLEAIEALKRQPYDVVLMDVQMPEMDGLEATRHIRREWPAEQSPHIIAMTANAMEGDREMCLAAGMDDYVSKPIRVEELVGALSKCRPIGEHRPAAESRGSAHEALVSSPVPSYRTRRTKPVAQPDGQEPKGSGQDPRDETPVAHPQIPVEERGQAAALDSAALGNLRNMAGGDTSFLAELIDTFFEDAPQLLADMHDAVEQGNAEGLGLAAHSLKSNSADFGATTFSGLCQALETMARAGTLAGAAELVAQAETEYEQVKAALEAVRADK